MNTTFIWVLLPGVLAAILLLFHRYERLTVTLSTLIAGLLATFAWWLPFNQRVSLGPVALEFVDTWSILGRQFVLGEADRPALVMLFLAAAFWCGGAYAAKTKSTFVPLALGIVTLLTAAIAVQPFLYAALLIELAVLVSIPLLIQPGIPVGSGVLRYLIFQTLGVPFILFSGWMLSGVEASPGTQALGTRAALLIGLGFIFLLAVFPFHSWVPMLAQDTHPYTVAFIFLLLPSAITFFGLGFLDQFAWLRNSQEVHLILRSIGVVMVFVAGFWAAFQRHLGRILGYAVLFEIGLSILTIGLGEGERAGIFLSIFFASLLPRGLALGVWSLALTAIRSQNEDLYYRDVQGWARKMPIAVSGLVLAHFTWLGLPLTAGFPVRIALLENLAQASPAAAVWVILGSFGLLLGGLRTLVVLVMGEDQNTWQVTERRSQRLFLIFGMLAILVVGILPQWLLPFFANLPRAFEHLAP